MTTEIVLFIAGHVTIILILVISTRKKRGKEKKDGE